MRTKLTMCVQSTRYHRSLNRNKRLRFLLRSSLSCRKPHPLESTRSPTLTSISQAMSVASRLFPTETRSTALALVFVFAQMGGSLFPILTGLLSTAYGVRVFQPMLVSLVVVTGVCWYIVPKPKESDNDELHQL
jgi:MFS family permease